MKGKILLFFAIIVLVSIPVQVLSAQSEEWLSIENEYFVIKYKEGHMSDAELILEYCQYARSVTMEAYPHQLDVKVTVYLYDAASWTRSPYSASADPTNAIMHFLTPSDVPEYAKSWVDNLWYQKNIVHEYVHVPTLKDLWKTKYYYNVGAPFWLTEGIAEYISVFRTTSGILQKYGHYTTNMRDTVINGSVFFEDYDSYRWGAYIMKYVYETYGQEKVSLLFKTNATYLWDAITPSLGISPTQFERNWIKWIYGEFNVAIPPEYLENEDLLEEYQQLSTAYDKLLADYNSLKSSYDSLQADYNSLQTNYNAVKSDYDSLDATHNRLAGDYEGLQTTYDSLKSDYDKLRTDYDTLKSDCESATKELEIEKSELATNTNLMYVFIITTLAFIATTAYLTIRKRKVKST